jgi:hypothetical protein
MTAVSTDIAIMGYCMVIFVRTGVLNARNHPTHGPAVPEMQTDGMAF